MHPINTKTARKALQYSFILLAFVVLVFLIPRISFGSLDYQRLSAGQPETFCPPEPTPSGNVIIATAAQAAELDEIIAGTKSGDTVLLADGIYSLQGDYLWFDTPDVTLRSASGNRESVIIDGNYQTNTIISIAASNVTITDLTLKRARHHLIHVMSLNGGNTNGTRLYNLHFIDPGQQAIKVNPATQNGFTDFGELACSEVELTDDGRPVVWQINGSCYTGGIDAHQSDSWHVRDNIFEGFWCHNGLSEHAIHFWKGSGHTIVERNIIKDNTRGVGYGLTADDGGRILPDENCQGHYIGHYGGLIRNNFIFQGRNALRDSDSGFDCGICLAQVCETNVLHNSVVATSAPFSSIEWRFSNTTAFIANNLVSHNLMQRDGAQAMLAGNLANFPLSLLLNADGGDLHLMPSASAAIDQGLPLSANLLTDDIDGDIRIGIPDIGADELSIEFMYHNYLPASYK